MLSLSSLKFKKALQNMSDFDFLLHRNLKDGKEFDKLIPASTCEKIDSGNGNTDLSMQLIKEAAEKYSWHMQKVAKLLNKGALQKTCDAIHDFAFDHFQYMADDNDQYLRSPACSWKQRHEGIDCKSYSIIASAILLELGMKHYIRKIKQPLFAPSEWTHVYVIVPKNQESGNLRHGYYTIDGTLAEKTEPLHVAKQDLFMKHFTLNRPASPVFGLQGLRAFNFDIKGFMSSLSCIGGTAYNETHYKGNVSKIVDFFDANILAINKAVASKNFAALSDEANELYGFSKLLALNFRAKRNEKSWNTCSGTNLDRTIDLSKFYSEGVALALTKYLDNFFTKSASGSMEYTAGAQVPLGIWGLDNSTGSKVTEPKYTYTVKTGVLAIPKFEITPYVAEKLTNPSKTFDIAQLLAGLTTIAASFGGSSNNGTTIGSGTGTGSGTGSYTQDNNILPKQAGMGVIGWVLLAAGAGIAFVKTKDSPSAQAKNTRSRINNKAKK